MQTPNLPCNEKSETVVTVNSLIPDEGVILKPIAALRPTTRKPNKYESSPEILSPEKIIRLPEKRMMGSF